MDRRRMLVWLALALLLVASVHALGLRPAQTLLDEVPNESQRFELFVINDEGRDLDVKVYAQGPLADIVRFERETYAIGPGGRSVFFSLDVDGQLPAGENVIEVVVEPQELWFRKSTFRAKLRLVHKLVLRGEIPEKYVKSRVDVAEFGNHIELRAKVANKGRSSLLSVQPRFSVSDGFETLLETEGEKRSLGVGEEAIFSKKVSTAELDDGEYQLETVVEYDELSLSLVKLFSIGSPSVLVERVDSFLRFDDINEFTFDVSSGWNQPIEDAWAEVDLFKGQTQILSSRSQFFTLGPLDRQEVLSFLDLRGVASGKYDAVLKVHFLDKVVEKRFSLEVVTDSVAGMMVDEGNRAAPPTEGNTLVYIVLLVLIFNVTLVIVVVVTTLKGRGEKERFKYE